MLTKDTFSTAALISFFMFPSFYRIQWSNPLSQKDDPVHNQYIANEAKAFFIRLNSQIKALNEAKTPLPDFQGEKDSRLHYAIEQLSYLKKDQKVYEENQELAEGTLIGLITAESSSILNRNDSQQTPLHLLALYSTDKVVQHLLTQLRILFSAQTDQSFEKNFINAQDKEGRTALHLAASRQQEGIAQLLLTNYDADPNIFDYYDHVPLHYAAASYVPWVKLLYDQTDSQNSSIWIKALKSPQQHQKYTKKIVAKTPCNHLNPKYCLLSGPVIEHYYHPLEENSIPTLLKKAQKESSDIAKYTMIAIPSLFNQILEKETYRNVLKDLLTEDKEGQLACLALDNPRFMEELLKENDLAQLITLSNQYPKFALKIFKTHIDNIKQHKGYQSYFDSLKDNYHASESTYDALCQTISSKLALFEIQNLVGNHKWDPRNVQNYKELIQNLVSSFLNKFRGEKEDTPLHIAAKRGAAEFIEEILNFDAAKKWYNITNKKGKSPFDLAVEADTPNTKVIELLYHHTDKKILESYLPILESSFIKDRIETVKECIEDHPYHLTNVLAHSKARIQYSMLCDISNNQPKENQLDHLLKAFSKDPLAMLVGVTCPAFKKQMQAILMDPDKSQRIFELVHQHKESIGTSNIEKLVLPIVKQSLALKKTVEEKKIFLQNIIKKHATSMPHVALYTLEPSHKGLITEDLLKTILYHYIPRHRVELLEMKYHDANKNLFEDYRKLAINTVREYISKCEDQFKVSSQQRQLFKMPAEQASNHLSDSDKEGNTILHRTLLVSNTIDNGLNALQPNTESDLYHREGLNNFLKLFRKTKASHEQSTLIKIKKVYTNSKLDNFLHIAASRDEKALTMVTECFNQSDLEGLLKEFCQAKNSQRKIPLKIALEAKNIDIVELLEKHTTDITFWQDAFKTPINSNDIEIIKTQLNTKFDDLKSGYRLLNRFYRDAFRKGIAIITSTKQWDQKAQALETIGKENIYALYTIIDCPALFEYLLACPQTKHIINIFTEHKAGSLLGQKALLEALENKEFLNTLKNSPHCIRITQNLANKYNVFLADRKNKEFSYDSLIQAIKAKLHENLQPPAPEIENTRPSLKS